jgi:hypothetical protein
LPGSTELGVPVFGGGRLERVTASLFVANVVDREHALNVIGVLTTSDALRALSQLAPQE